MVSMSETDIPYGLILHPTMQEFSNFAEYWEKLEKEKKLNGFGIIKVVPPAKWKPRAQPLKHTINDIMVVSPIEQNVQGKAGVYELLLMQKKSMSVADYRKKVETFDAITDKKEPEEVESLFWKNICFSPPLYGADMKGSLFDEGVKWNLGELNGVLKEGLLKPISGVNDPYLYVGSWKTMFGWHKEDIDLYSINYVHYGKPKFWYCLPQTETEKLEKFAKQHFPEGFSKCKEYLRHKTIMISPYLLKQNIPDLKIHKMIHYPGEFVITMGGAYHAGFNWGFNVAEAVNFATTRWLDLFQKAHSCKCVGDSVKIDADELFKNLAHSSYKDHPTVKKILLQRKSGVAISKKSQDKMDIEKPSRSDRRNNTNYSASVSTRTSGVSESESNEDDDVNDRSPSTERPRTRSSSRNHKRTKAISKTRTGKAVAEKRKTTKEEKTEVSKVSRSKKIQKRIIKPTKKMEELAKSTPKAKVHAEVHSLKAKTKTLASTAPSSKIKKVSDQLLVENWVQCENCTKWRKITKKEVWNKVQNKKAVICKDLPNFSCRVTEEEWKSNYMTIPTKYRIKATAD